MKIVEVAKATKELVLRLESVPSSVLMKVLLTLPEPASSSVMSSIRSSSPQTEQTVIELRVMAEYLPPAVAVAVNPETQTSELIVVVSPNVPSDDNEFELRARELLFLGSDDTACPLADLERADVAAATAAVTAAADDDDDDDRPGSLSSVRARTPARRGSKLPAPPTAGKPNVWLSGLLSAPSLPSTSDVSPRRTAPVAGGELGCGTRPRTSSILDREAPPR